MKLLHFKYILAVYILISFSAFSQNKANYQLAEQFRQFTHRPLTDYSFDIRPVFINKSNCFYYSLSTDQGKTYYYVNPKKKTQRLLFDNKELLRKINNYSEKSHRKFDRYFSFTFEKDNKTMRFEYDNMLFNYNIDTEVLTHLGDTPKRKMPDPYWMKHSPDSLYFLFASKDNLYFTGNPDKDQDTTVVQLTFDGEPNYTFNREDEGTMEGRFGAETAHWMPNSHYFYAKRVDSRNIGDLWLINSLSDKPELTTYKAELAADKNVKQYEILVGNVETKEVKIIDTYRWPDQYIDILYASEDGERLYFQRYNRSWSKADICEIDVQTGDVRVVIHEENLPYIDYQMRSVSFLNDGKEILFRSERNGWGHYYLYETATGNLKNQVTDGAWVAGQIHKVDTLKRDIYFYGFGREKDYDPHYYVLYKANLDKRNAVELLTPGNTMHDATLSPNNRYIVDSYSTVSEPPVNVVRNRKGKVIMKLTNPSPEPFYKLGWRAPERFSVKAADGVTDLYGVMWKPSDFDSTRQYPIISNVYPGPFFEYVPTRFTINDDYNTRLAQLGFIVITVGHRGGTPMRGKEYHTYGYNNQRDHPLADDKYAIEQLAQRHSFIDIDRVGIYGHSGGGFMSAAAICTYPDFYKAAVASAGNHDNTMYKKGFVEIHYGVNEKVTTETDSLGIEHKTYDYSVSARPNQELAKNYKHGLLIFHGAMDKTVNPSHSIRLADALIKENKDFQMYILPKSTHGFFSESGTFFEQKMWRHFSRLLLDDNSADFDVDLTKDIIEDDKR